MKDPFVRFGELFERAQASDIVDPTSMALATATPDGRPSVRIVLLKSFDERGFVFYTNLRSRKGEELRTNPHAAIVLHWDAIETQVRVEGPVEAVSEEEADAYFASRPRGSQIGAWASLQSQGLPNRDDLEERVREIDGKYEGEPVPRPPHWSGFRIVPQRIEFWTGKPSRLHERDVYQRDLDTGGWTTSHLYP